MTVRLKAQRVLKQIRYAGFHEEDARAAWELQAAHDAAGAVYREQLDNATQATLAVIGEGVLAQNTGRHHHATGRATGIALA